MFLDVFFIFVKRSGHFTWESYHNAPADRKASDPAPTPTMAGGLFGVNRKFFFDVGAYDAGMIGWGGENLELSFRVWMCGGRMEVSSRMFLLRCCLISSYRSNNM